MRKRGHWWWGAIQAALRLYPELRQRYGTPDNRMTAQYTAQPSCGGAGRPAEQLAMGNDSRTAITLFTGQFRTPCVRRPEWGRAMQGLL